MLRFGKSITPLHMGSRIGAFLDHFFTIFPLIFYYFSSPTQFNFFQAAIPAGVYCLQTVDNDIQYKHRTYTERIIFSHKNTDRIRIFFYN